MGNGYESFAERKAGGAVIAGVDLETRPKVLILGEVEVMEKVGVVVKGEARHLLEGSRIKLEGGGDCRLLGGEATGQHGLLEIGLKRLAPAQDQLFRFPDYVGGRTPGSGIVEGVEGKTVREVRPRMGLQLRRADFVPGRIAIPDEIEPVIIPPLDLLDRGFPTEIATTGPGQGAAAEMGHIPFAGGSFHKAGVAGLLEGEIVVPRRGEDGIGRVHLVWSIDRARARECHGMVILSATLGSEKVVVSVTAVEMRPLGEADLAPLENHTGFPDQGFGLMVVFL